MVNLNEVQETNRMIEEENLDVRTITMGISLLDCAHSDCSTFQRKIFVSFTVASAQPSLTRTSAVPV